MRGSSTVWMSGPRSRTIRVSGTSAASGSGLTLLGKEVDALTDPTTGSATGGLVDLRVTRSTVPSTVTMVIRLADPG